MRAIPAHDVQHLWSAGPQVFNSRNGYPDGALSLSALNVRDSYQLLSTLRLGIYAACNCNLALHIRFDDSNETSSFEPADDVVTPQYTET